MPANQRAELFAETADRKGLSDAIVEKDFWVCWVLKQLFSIDAFAGRLLFKGGTSLSKIFHAINRFSEDIDLAVDYAALGFTGERDPRRETISKTRRAAILTDMMTTCQHYIGGKFLTTLKARCEEVLGKSDAWSLDVSEQDPNVVRFRYPAATAKNLAYVSPQVVLELGSDGLVLAPEKLRLYLRSRLGISVGGTAWDEREMLDLGVINVGDHALHLVYALRQPPQGVGDGFRARAAGAHLVLLIPSPQTDSSELAKVMLDSPLPTRIQVVRSAISACGLDHTVPAIHIAPDAARLVVDTQFKEVWVDGIEIKDLPSHAFRLIELMARSSRCVSTEYISTELSPGRQDGNTTARQAKNIAKRIITQAMTAAGRVFDEDPFPPAGAGFYRCALPPFVR
jgi:hypothetical protein